MSERPHAKLEVWKKSIKLVTEIYGITKKYPKEELYGLVSQMRRSAISIPSNIAEGVARRTTKEYIQFLYISRSSLSELDTQLEISMNLEYIGSEEYERVIEGLDELGRMLSGLIGSLKKKR